MKSKIESELDATVLYYIEIPDEENPAEFHDSEEGPWDTRAQAQEFLDNEVGAPGAKIVSYVCYGMEVIASTTVQVGVAKALRRFCDDTGKSHEEAVRMAIIDYLSRLGLLK